MLRTAAINFSAAGDNTAIAALAGIPINVYALSFTVSGATNITFKDSAGTAFSGAFVLTGNGSSLTFPIQGSPWIQVLAGNGFVINSSGAVAVGGMVWYALG